MDTVSIFLFHSASLLTTVPYKTDLYNEWRPFYLSYNLLKRELKVRGAIFTR